MDSESQSADYLESLQLPIVPEHLRDVLSVNRIGRGGQIANSAISASTNKDGEPRTMISFWFRKKKVIEEEYAYKELRKELPIFIEVAEETF